MGHGLVPGPANDLYQPILIDTGTNPRTESPTPDPIGLDAKGGTPTQPSLADQILSFPTQRLGNRVGNGECFTLVDEALKGAGARSAADFGKVTPNASYVWGTSIGLSEVKPGDVIQFRNYRFDRKVESKTAVDEDFQERGTPNHTAIVESVDADGAITVLEQNAPDGSPVARAQLFFRDRSTASGGVTTTIKVKGSFKFYRPQAR